MGWMIGSLSPSRDWEFISSPCIQTGSGAHPTYSMGTRSSFPGGKLARE